jgi:hypothetical protein
VTTARPAAGQIEIIHEPERKRWDHWRQTKDAPAHHAHIYYEHDTTPETMWCAVVEVIAANHFRVRLLNDSPFQPSLRWGTSLQASWDGQARHFATGRPTFQPC